MNVGSTLSMTVSAQFPIEFVSLSLNGVDFAPPHDNVDYGKFMRFEHTIVPEQGSETVTFLFTYRTARGDVTVPVIHSPFLIGETLID